MYDPHAQTGARSQSAFASASVPPSKTGQAQNVTPSTGARLRTGSAHVPEQQRLSQLVPLTNVQQEFSSPLPPSLANTSCTNNQGTVTLCRNNHNSSHGAKRQGQVQAASLASSNSVRVMLPPTCGIQVCPRSNTRYASSRTV